MHVALYRNITNLRKHPPLLPLPPLRPVVQSCNLLRSLWHHPYHVTTLFRRPIIQAQQRHPRKRNHQVRIIRPNKIHVTFLPLLTPSPIILTGAKRTPSAPTVAAPTVAAAAAGPAAGTRTANQRPTSLRSMLQMLGVPDNLRYAAELPGDRYRLNGGASGLAVSVGQRAGSQQGLSFWSTGIILRVLMDTWNQPLESILCHLDIGSE